MMTVLCCATDTYKMLVNTERGGANSDLFWTEKSQRFCKMAVLETGERPL